MSINVPFCVALPQIHGLFDSCYGEGASRFFAFQARQAAFALGGSLCRVTGMGVGLSGDEVGAAPAAQEQKLFWATWRDVNAMRGSASRWIWDFCSGHAQAIRGLGHKAVIAFDPGA